jgi:hypothetical protein
MPPKAKKELDDGDLPDISRVLCKVRVVGDASMADVKRRLSKIKQRGVIAITREKILEYAETNGLYVNLETWDSKKKVPEGAATSLTPDLLTEFYKKFIREQDLIGQRFKVACLDAEKAGKDKPQDPRWIEDPKKAKKEPPKKKDPKAVEEVEEKEAEEIEPERSCDYIYIMFDDFDSAKDLFALTDFADVVLLTCRVNLPKASRSRKSLEDDSKRP